MVRRVTACVLTLLFALSLVQAASTAAITVRVVVDGRVLRLDQPAMIVNGSTMVPMRAIFEALGARVTWENAS